MKPVKSSLQSWISKNKNFKQRHLELKEEILSDPMIQEVLSKHPHLPERVIEKNLVKFYEYMTQSKSCHTCKSFDTCQNILQGYTPKLLIENNEVHITYEKCHKRMVYEQRKTEQKLIESLYMPKEILNATIGEIDADPKRSESVQEIFHFISEAKDELPKKGLFLYGPFGVGKTYLLGALANKLTEYNISSTLIYMPEFVRELRDAIRDDSVNEKINYFKKADVLMIDDIGAETQSAWFRDEVLGSILQFRMMENMPVFFTSNYSMKQLEKHLATSTNGKIEEVKAGRIMERIRQVSREVQVDGKNRRRQS